MDARNDDFVFETFLLIEYSYYIMLLMCVTDSSDIDMQCLDCFLHTQPRSTTPLYQAAAMGHYDAVAVLLAYNADGTKKDRV